ncbi:cobalt transporter CbiM [Insolitispirillum peregrinum]|uniref:Cobalt/nickel transport system permease protein n=1 Tax=Insolitispirillum peregrinum TaxID=80876 RepID=A0A1N7PFF8_9PROT|nr:cobalt transporter CbiM [Insolitispirillum peregrinum]SIT09276.1 cobalt/nickel transport system permease protein [Insolitispirillum peregrinum]
MHIVDGALSSAVVIGGAVLTVGGLALGVRSLTLEKLPAAGILSATFFVASLIHVPIGPSSVHLIMNGLAGLVLGWSAFPALFVGLLLQAVFFGFGGLTVLGVNTLNIALPAVLIGLVCQQGIRHANPRIAALWGALAGSGAIALTTLCVAVALLLSGQEFIPAAKLVFLSHIPIMVIEGLVCAAAVYLIRRVNPTVFASLEGHPA